MKVHRRSRNIIPVYLNLGAERRWVLKNCTTPGEGTFTPTVY
jgi:hypothetical protein